MNQPEFFNEIEVKGTCHLQKGNFEREKNMRSLSSTSQARTQGSGFSWGCSKVLSQQEIFPLWGLNFFLWRKLE